MASEYTDVVPAFLIQRLAGDSTIQSLVGARIYDTNLPQADTQAERAALYPCIVFSLFAANPALKGNGDTIIWETDDYQVMALNQSKDFTTVTEIAARIRQLLHGFKGPLASDAGYIQSCSYRRAVKGTQQGLFGTFLRLGGIYRITARLSSS